MCECLCVGMWKQIYKYALDANCSGNIPVDVCPVYALTSQLWSFYAFYLHGRQAISADD